MTTATLRKYRTYLTDEKGKPVAVQLDLRNKVIRQAYEEMMEDLEDLAEAKARMKELKADPSLAVPFEEFAREYLASIETK
ncbi:MAG: hypothetical protein U5M51_12385 [Emticicia sp.]|nr:hypothetical protein [Emticicia sp.]